MKVLIINTDYPEFLHGLYQQHAGLEEQCYDEQLRIRYASLFGVADFYSRNLRELGHDAYDVYANNAALQIAWAVAYGSGARVPNIPDWCDSILSQARHISSRLPLRLTEALLRPLIGRIVPRNDEAQAILAAQIKHYKPDVILNQAMDGIENRFLREMKPLVRLIVGQHAATRLPEDSDYSCYDLVVSSFQPTVEFFQRKGMAAVLHRLGFEPAIASYPTKGDGTYPVSFIGSLSAVHRSRIAWLENICARIPELRVWGPGFEQLPPESPLRQCHMGVAWGRDMYEILRQSKITLNHHGDVAPYANNCRLFESTGMGTMLITDWKANLLDMFQPGKEVAAYRSSEECAEMIRYYLDHDESRTVIACAGQGRTLRDHTYWHRMQEFVEIVQKRLAA